MSDPARSYFPLKIKCAVFRPPDEIPRAFYENSGGKEKEALGSNGVMADLNIGERTIFVLCQSRF